MKPTSRKFKFPFPTDWHRLNSQFFAKIAKGTGLLFLGVYVTIYAVRASDMLLRFDGIGCPGSGASTTQSLSLTPPSSERSAASSRASSHGGTVHSRDEDIGRIVGLLPTYSAVTTEAAQKAFVTDTLGATSEPVEVAYTVGLELLQGSLRVTRQPERARWWLAYANNAKHPGAANLLYQLGLLYLDGRDGMAQDPALAKDLFVSAAAGGCADALIMLDPGDFALLSVQQ